VLVLTAGLWTLAAADSATNSLETAEHHGTEPLDTLTRARILLQEARADDELTLVTRDSDSSYQDDYDAAASTLSTVLSTDANRWSQAEQVDLSAASGYWDQYQSTHSEVRRLDTGQGQLAAALAADDGATGSNSYTASSESSNADDRLGSAVALAAKTFDTKARSASNDLGDLALGSIVLMVMAALAVIVGVEPRIREYR
jgi:hypothetical protein